VVESVENLSNLTGKVTKRSAHPSLKGYDLLDLEVESTSPVDERPDLLASTVGTHVELTVDHALLDDSVQAGATVTCKARRTPDGAIADRDPTSFHVQPG
jgi:hypothetical protein